MTVDGEEYFDRELLLGVFLAEAQELLTTYEQSLVELERAPRNDELINAIFRVAHTMKGNAASLGFESLVEIAHAAEELLDPLRAHRFEVTPELITLLLECGDHLKAQIDHAAKKTEEVLPADANLLAALCEASKTGECERKAAAEPEATAAANGGRRDATIRASVAKLDAMLALAGEIAIVRSRLRTLIMPVATADLHDAQERLDRLCSDLEADLMRIRMIPIEPVLHQQARLVRDLAQSSGKLVELQCFGGDVEADTAVIEQMRAPLMHMVRNAVDHGIESPEARARLGKPAVGTITIRASHEASMLVLDVSDDGAGIDTQRVLEKARRLGLTNNETLTEAEVRRLIFTPGFTTSEAVTDVSGRGVGMDVVHQTIVALRGSISVTSTPGAGTTFSIRVPLSLAIIDALAVEAGPETYVLPLEFVVECVDVEEKELRGGRAGLLDLRGRPIPFVRLAACMGIDAQHNERKSAVIVSNRKRVSALVLDRLVGRIEAVVKPLGAFSKLQGIAGATVLGDGNVALILDVPRLLQKEIREVA